MARPTNQILPISLLFLFLFISASQAIVPPDKTFKYINQGEFGEYSVEYLADYRVLDIYTSPFTLCFYNSTPNAFILGLRMGTRRTESIMRWVWDANRGNPVRENATLTFGSNGNLVLADVDGKVAWQTGTANKGVVGLELLQNGNLVLYDNKGRFIWQSFDHPTDTLLVGQSLKMPTNTRGPIGLLVSRLSNTEPVNGPYSFVMEQRHWAMYYQSKNSKNPMPYYKSDEFGNGKGALAYLGFFCESEYGQNFAFELGFLYNMTNSDSFGASILTRPKYNSTFSMLRVDMDGNLKIYTYNENVDWGAWEVTYALFNTEDYWPGTSLCKMPRKCGSLGVCEDSQCIGCPKPQGLFGWSRNCAPPVLPPCKTGAASVDYYKVDGVEHFTSGYDEGKGPMKVTECKKRCSNDCKCLGFFYREESSKCLLVPELGTLSKVSNSSHVGYIKMSK